MEVSWERINRDLNGIIRDFDNLLYEDKYEEAMKVIEEIHNLAERTYKIKLDEKDEYDHVFHEVYKKLEDKVKGKTPEATETLEYLALLEYIKTVSADIFKTADIREKAIETEKDRDEFISDYKQGIEDAKKEISKLEDLYEEYLKIRKEIFGDKDPDLKIRIGNGNYNAKKLENIKSDLIRINEYKEAISLLLASSDPDKDRLIENNKREINELTETINRTINEMKRRGLDTSSIESITELEIGEAKTRIDNLKVIVEEELKKNYEELANRLIQAKHMHPDVMALAAIDESKFDPSTKEGREAIDRAYIPFEQEFKNIETEKKVQKEYIAIFEEQIEKLETEKEIASVDTMDTEKFRSSIDEVTRDEIEEEKRIAHENNRDSVYGNEEKAQKYEEYFKKFKEHIQEATFTYVASDGTEKTGTYKTLIDSDTPEMKEILKFLNLETYKEKLERITKYDAIRETDPESANRIYLQEIDKDPEMRMLVEEAIKKGIDINGLIDKRKENDRHYVETYHGAKNAKKMKYENYRTAGSTLKSMIPLSTGETGLERTGIAAKNVLNFFNIKVPKFTSINKDGIRVKDVKGGLVTLGTDALVLAGYGLAGVALVTGTAVPIAAGIGAAVGIRGVAKGTRIGIQRGILANSYKRKNRENLEIPNPYENSEYGRRQARARYYREEEGRSSLGASSKAFFDTFRKKRARNTEETLIEQRNEKLDEQIEKRYINGARSEYRSKQQLAEENLEIRREAYREKASRADTYGDIIREPEIVDDYKLSERITQASGIEIEGHDSEPYKMTESSKIRNKQFEREKRPVRKLYDLGGSEIEYGATVGDKLEERTVTDQETEKSIQSRINAQGSAIEVATSAALGGVVKHLFAKLFPRMDEVVMPGEDKVVEETVTRKETEIVRDEKVEGKIASFDSTGRHPSRARLRETDTKVGAVSLVDESGKESVYSSASGEIKQWITRRGLNEYAAKYNFRPLDINSSDAMNNIVNQIPKDIMEAATKGFTEIEKYEYLLENVRISLGNANLPSGLTGVQRGWIKLGDLFSVENRTVIDTIQKIVEGDPYIVLQPHELTLIEKILHLVPGATGLINHKSNVKGNPVLDKDNPNKKSQRKVDLENPEYKENPEDWTI